MKVRLLHLAALVGFAVAQPLYDVLRKSGEFFVAHRADRTDIFLLIWWLSAALPLVLAILVWIAARTSEKIATALTTGLVGLLVGIIVLPAASRWSGAGAAEVLAVSGLHAITAALVYGRFPVARQFLTLLSPAAIVFPLVFVFQPAMRPFVRPENPTAGSAADIDGDTPVVVVIFDQLPLTSLLDATGEIDAHSFPAFAALAADSMWFRNATATADFTGWAVPAIVSGQYPRAKALPIAGDYPHNLFTALGADYRIEAVEPITRLCPSSLCPDSAEPRRVRQIGMLSDLSVVYARIVLPEQLTTDLPRLTDNWRDFIRGQHWQARWTAARDRDRRDAMRRLIDSISSSDPQPTLYFGHILLPHEPYVYLRDGRQFTAESDLLGLGPRGVWSHDPWYPRQAYRRHLLQVGFVDSLIGSLVEQLKRENLYDRALIVVTSDHGVAFRHDQPMKGFRPGTMVDTVPIPLFIKPPHHSGTKVSDRNVQSVDILPTVTNLLHAQLPFPTDGISAVGSRAASAEKRVYFAGATQTAHLPPSLWTDVVAAAQRKAEIFGTTGPDDAWRPEDVPFKALLDRPVADLTVGKASGVTLELSDAWRFGRIDTKSDFIPARLAGLVHGDATNVALPLAIAVNGVVRATTKTVEAPLPSAGTWSAIVAPSAFHDGVNPVDVYEVTSEGERVVLRPALHSSTRPTHLNLVSGEAYDWILNSHGFYPREPFGERALRWTNGDGEMSLFEGPNYRQATLHVELAPMTRAGEPLTIAVNDCTLFEGELPGGPWDRSFSLGGCPESALESATVTIRIKSDRAHGPGNDSRWLGVPVVGLEFTPR